MLVARETNMTKSARPGDWWRPARQKHVDTHTHTAHANPMHYTLHIQNALCICFAHILCCVCLVSLSTCSVSRQVLVGGEPSEEPGRAKRDVQQMCRRGGRFLRRKHGVPSKPICYVGQAKYETESEPFSLGNGFGCGESVDYSPLWNIKILLKKDQQAKKRAV